MNNEWIRVSYLKPDMHDLKNGIYRSDDVLIALPGDEMTIASLIYDADMQDMYWLSHIGEYRYNIGLVTHWQKVPKHPNHE